MGFLSDPKEASTGQALGPEQNLGKHLKKCTEKNLAESNEENHHHNLQVL